MCDKDFLQIQVTVPVGEPNYKNRNFSKGHLAPFLQSAYAGNTTTSLGCDLPVKMDPLIGARPRLVEPSSDTGTKLARSKHDLKNFAQVGRDSRPHRDELRASYARAGNELCDVKNHRRLVADVKNTFRVSASFGRLQKSPAIPKIRAMLDGTSGVLRPFVLPESQYTGQPGAEKARVEPGPTPDRASHRVNQGVASRQENNVFFYQRYATLLGAAIHES
ncbi:hypothetical protein Bbelb_081100 [Branchiostoma belcheri]|nr:hypothetical protein Bbelb_081100 [Branchiostoma belcheri]